MKLSALIITLVLVVLALTSFLFVRIEAGKGGTFVAAQQSAERLTAAAVDRVVRNAPETVGAKAGVSAACQPHGGGTLDNPWNCSISYSDGRRIDYVVQVQLDGHYTGIDQVVHYNGQVSRGNGQISGCCIVIP